MITKEQFEKLPRIRVFSSAGPCLRLYRLVKRNKKTATVAYKNGDSIDTKRVSLVYVHTEPCRCCTDHPDTMYPDGYMN